MASTISNYLQGKIADWLNGTTFPAAPTSVYIALYTVAPTNAGGGTEVSGGSYARVAVAAAGWTKSGTSPVQLVNTAITDFGTATGNWGTVVAAAIMDAASVGNQIAWATLTASKTVNNGDGCDFPASSLVFQIGV